MMRMHSLCDGKTNNLSSVHTSTFAGHDNLVLNYIILPGQERINGSDILYNPVNSLWSSFVTQWLRVVFIVDSKINLIKFRIFLASFEYRGYCQVSSVQNAESFISLYECSVQAVQYSLFHRLHHDCLHPLTLSVSLLHTVFRLL